MDGLFTLLILYWIVKLVFGKKPKAKKAIRSAFSNTAQVHAERARQIHEELVKRKEEKAQQLAMEDVHAMPAGEGEALPCFEGFGHTGSLHVETTEGMDLCDPSLEHDRETPDPQSVYANEIGREPMLDFSAKGVYQGVVMSEILKRPAERGCRR